jgi:regulator of telomere elongation helicase 1
MISRKITGITVELPSEPHPTQTLSISTLLKAFMSKTSALIENPTGTSKSFSILCSSLAYLNHFKNSHDDTQKPIKQPKIYICSRT